MVGWPGAVEIVYLLVRRVLGFAVLVFRRDLTKEAELLALRHENAALRRQAKRIQYEPAGVAMAGITGDTGQAAQAFQRRLESVLTRLRDAE